MIHNDYFEYIYIYSFKNNYFLEKVIFHSKQVKVCKDIYIQLYMLIAPRMNTRCRETKWAALKSMQITFLWKENHSQWSKCEHAKTIS